MLKWVVALSVSLIAAVVGLVDPRAALAADGSAACMNQLQSAFADANHDPVAFTGYYSHLDPQTLHLCTNPAPGAPSGSWGWAAIGAKQASCSPPGSCLYSILQIGRGACRYSQYSGCNGTQQRIFVSYGREANAHGCGGLYTILPIPLDRGAVTGDTGLHYYRLWTNGSRWYFDHWPKGGAIIPEFDIAASLMCWDDREGITFAETWDRGDALGGYAANHYNFKSMARQATVGGAWTADFVSTCATTPGSVYLCSVTASQDWEAWTNR